ncbi:MAG: helix-turn-helix transcriptional regulator [Caulobacterales bacterium]
MKHGQIWAAVDALAARHNLTPSGLAKQAGLDPTTFNKSKRAADGDKPRWPSTESVAKALEAVGESFEAFAILTEGPARSMGRISGKAVPLIGFAQAGADGYFDDSGFPAGQGWDEVRFPGLESDDVYALEITGDSMEPVYRAGDRIVVSPDAQPRRGDRVVVKTTGGEVMAKQLGRMSAKKVELLSLNPAYPPREIELANVSWIARIVWASQ